MADEHAPLDRRTVHRIVATTAKKAGIGHAHPHQLRHTLATQAINRGMRLETIAEMLGHRSMDMTLVYARIANRVVAASTPRSWSRSTRSTRRRAPRRRDHPLLRPRR